MTPTGLCDPRGAALVPLSYPAVSVPSTPPLGFLVSIHLRFSRRVSTLNIL